MKQSDRNQDTRHTILIVPPTTAATLTGKEAERERALWNMVHAMRTGDITPEQAADAGAALTGQWREMDGAR